MKKNLGIIMLDNNINEVEDYLIYLIKELRKCFVDDLYILPSTLSVTELYKIKSYIKNNGIYSNLLENIEQQIYNQEIEQIVIFDDSFFGPFIDPEIMFRTMEQCNVDFWTVDSSDKPYMLVLNSSTLKNDESLCKKVFELINYGNLNEIYLYLSGITRLHKDTYIKIRNSEGIDVGLELTYEAIAEEKCPFVRIDCFSFFSISNSSSENARNTYDYIQNNTEYDTKLIWYYILKKNNIEQIKKALHLEYILPWVSEELNHTKEVLKDTAVVIHLHYTQLIRNSFNYIRNIPKEIDVYITTSDNVTKELIADQIKESNLENCRIIMKENRGRDISALLVASCDVTRKYKYIGFIHDKDFHKGEVRTRADSFRYNLWENSLKSDAYIKNILHLFEDNPCLGLLCPPEPFNGDYLGTMGNSWHNNFENTVELSRKLKLNCNLDIEHSTLTLGTVFWCRIEALRPLFDYGFRYEDFMEEPMDTNGTISHAIERILCYVAQSCGFYTAMVMNTDYASLRGNCLQNVAKNLLVRYKQKINISLKEINIIKKEFEEFCEKWPRLYIYGMGNYARQCLSYTIQNQIELAGIIVSEGNRDINEWYGYKVYEINEVKCDNSEMGIILALGKKNIEEVLPNLLNAGWENVLCGIKFTIT